MKKTKPPVKSISETDKFISNLPDYIQNDAEALHFAKKYRKSFSASSYYSGYADNKEYTEINADIFIEYIHFIKSPRDRKIFRYYLKGKSLEFISKKFNHNTHYISNVCYECKKLIRSEFFKMVDFSITETTYVSNNNKPFASVVMKCKANEKTFLLVRTRKIYRYTLTNQISEEYLQNKAKILSHIVNNNNNSLRMLIPSRLEQERKDLISELNNYVWINEDGRAVSRELDYILTTLHLNEFENLNYQYNQLFK